MTPIHVVAAVILDDKDRVFLARRPVDKHQGGLWEFPGGKVEPGEQTTAALCRELEEELGIQPTACQPLIRIRHDYSDKSILLDVWTVTAFTGEPHGREGQAVRWVNKAELGAYQFPAANRPIIAAARLPQRYLVTGQFSSVEQLVQRVRACLKRGHRLVQFRAPWLQPEEYQDCVAQLLPLFSEGQQLIVKGDISWLEHKGIAGLHLTSAQLHQLYCQGWRYSHSNSSDTNRSDANGTGSKWLLASCHNREQIEQAQAVGAHAVTLSPVQSTHSHPAAEPLGWHRAGQLIDSATVPVYCLGGMSEQHLPDATALGAQGIAAIGCWWAD